MSSSAENRQLANPAYSWQNDRVRSAKWLVEHERSIVDKIASLEGEKDAARKRGHPDLEARYHEQIVSLRDELIAVQRANVRSPEVAEMVDAFGQLIEAEQGLPFDGLAAAHLKHVQHVYQLLEQAYEALQASMSDPDSLVHARALKTFDVLSKLAKRHTVQVAPAGAERALFAALVRRINERQTSLTADERQKLLGLFLDEV